MNPLREFPLLVVVAFPPNPTTNAVIIALLPPINSKKPSQIALTIKDLSLPMSGRRTLKFQLTSCLSGLSIILFLKSSFCKIMPMSQWKQCLKLALVWSSQTTRKFTGRLVLVNEKGDCPKKKQQTTQPKIENELHKQHLTNSSVFYCQCPIVV